MNFAAQDGRTVVFVPREFLSWILLELESSIPRLSALRMEFDYTISSSDAATWARALREGLARRAAELEQRTRVPRSPDEGDASQEALARRIVRARFLERDAIYRALWEVAELCEYAAANGQTVEYTEYV